MRQMRRRGLTCGRVTTTGAMLISRVYTEHALLLYERALYDAAFTIIRFALIRDVND